MNLEQSIKKEEGKYKSGKKFLRTITTPQTLGGMISKVYDDKEIAKYAKDERVMKKVEEKHEKSGTNPVKAKT